MLFLPSYTWYLDCYLYKLYFDYQIFSLVFSFYHTSYPYGYSMTVLHSHVIDWLIMCTGVAYRAHKMRSTKIYSVVSQQISAGAAIMGAVPLQECATALLVVLHVESVSLVTSQILTAQLEIAYVNEVTYTHAQTHTHTHVYTHTHSILSNRPAFRGTIPIFGSKFTAVPLFLYFFLLFLTIFLCTFVPINLINLANS